MIIIDNNKTIERRIRERMPLKTNLTIKSYSGDQVINEATIINISAGGIHFKIPVGCPKLQLHEICTFIFDLPGLGKNLVLGEIYFCHDQADPPPQNGLHYRAKFINLPMQTWLHIKNYCRHETVTPSERAPEYSPEAQRTFTKTPLKNETLTSRTLALIDAHIRLEDGSTFPGKVKDIDFEGITLQLSESIPINMNLYVMVSFAEYGFMATGACDWCDQAGPELDLFLANIRFNDIEPDQFDRFKSLMMKLAVYMADWILKSHDSLANSITG